MANKPSLIMTMVDWRSTTATEDSRSKILQKVVFGGIKFKTITRSSGGGVMDVEHFIPKIEPIQFGIVINGFDRDLMPGTRGRWTFAAAMRDRVGNRIPLRGEVEGVITEWTPDEASPEDFKGCNSAVKEITHFDLNINGEPWFYIDDGEGEIRRLGESITAADRTALGI